MQTPANSKSSHDVLELKSTTAPPTEGYSNMGFQVSRRFLLFMTKSLQIMLFLTTLASFWKKAAGLWKCRKIFSGNTLNLLFFSFLGSSWADKPEKSLLIELVLIPDLPCHLETSLSSLAFVLGSRALTVIPKELEKKERMARIQMLDVGNTWGVLPLTASPKVPVPWRPPQCSQVRQTSFMSSTKTHWVINVSDLWTGCCRDLEGVLSQGITGLFWLALDGDFSGMSLAVFPSLSWHKSHQQVSETSWDSGSPQTGSPQTPHLRH